MADTITIQDAKYDAVVSAIIKLPIEEWLGAIRVAVNAEQDINVEGGRQLLEKAMVAVEKEQKCHEIRATIISSDVDLDPHTFTFMIFRSARVAELLLKDPSKRAQLRTEAQIQAYNVGLKDQLELFDLIAENPEEALRGFFEAIVMDESQKLFGNCSLREICCVMAHYVDNYNDAICSIYEQYSTIPTWEEIGSAGKGGRPARTRNAKKLD